MLLTDFIQRINFYFSIIFLADMETKYRQDLLSLLKRVHASASKEGAPQHKISVGLKKVLDKHIKNLPTDKALGEMFLEMGGTLAFCETVIRALTQDSTIEFTSSKPKPVVVARTRRKHGELHKLLPLTKTVEYDPGPDPVPTAEELRTYYRSVLDLVVSRYPGFVAPPEVLKLYRKEFAAGPYVDVRVPAGIHHLLCLVGKEETDPLLFPLRDRLERLLLCSLVAFLPVSEVVAFLTGTWDGREESLQQWEHEHYHEPIARIVENSQLTDAEKTRRLRPVLDHWAVVERCFIIASLRPIQVEEFLRQAVRPWNVRRRMNAALILEGMAAAEERRMMAVDARMNVLSPVRRMANYYAFWDLSWLPWATSRVLVPMDPATLPLSEKQFASQYFDVCTMQTDTTLWWCGKVPFRIEYMRDDGVRVVQNEEMYDSHRRYHEEKGWDLPVACLPVHEREVWIKMILSWVSSSLQSILDVNVYDIAKMTRLVSRPILAQRTLGQMVRRAYHVVGRLHPFFSLSKHHGVLHERVRHLYFAPHMMSELPRDLVFPEYFLGTDSQREAVDELWEAHREEFASCLLTQCAHESFKAAGAGTLPTRGGLPPVRKRDRNVYVYEDGRVGTLTESMEEWEETGYFWDEDIVPGGLEALGLFVEAPGYFKTVNTTRSLSESDVHRFLDGLVTVPSYSPYPIDDSDSNSERSDTENQNEDENESDSE